MSELSCPIDHVKVDENKMRLIALLVSVCGIGYLLTGYILIIVFVIVDFLPRMLGNPQYSLLAKLAGLLAALLKLKQKPTDRGPKRFAAGMGLVFNLLILFVALMHWVTAATVLTAMLCCFAFLEAFAAVCIGCFIYTILQKTALIR
ncbi:DUF4395 domain-containing protein [Mucilaginibacter pallidiroseus]|uniref:DUF4395 domain-containing protein n=1 Tax=Mucilaginibacter pallidiroseus TaxID=2599295 RepID=A0A563UG84_9SPHI|nr:DUF4395 domain-containing protein [Mucilaginibacter pallidiroseus]TWR30283.1 DUF4395 domain-containing protein [Mucilaginibacter pallidiroseus]